MKSEIAPYSNKVVIIIKTNPKQILNKIKVT